MVGLTRCFQFSFLFVFVDILSAVSFLHSSRSVCGFLLGIHPIYVTYMLFVRTTCIVNSFHLHIANDADLNGNCVGKGIRFI